MKAWLARLFPRVAGAPASRSDALKVAVRLQPTGQPPPKPAASCQRRLTARPQFTDRVSAHAAFQASLTRRGPAGYLYPRAKVARLPSLPRYVMNNGSTRRAFGLTILLFGLAAGLLAQQPATEESRSRFGAVDIHVDSGSTPLAAYQLEFAATNGVARIVGIEGGEHPVFRQPPFYDPKALQHERVIIASFSTASAAKLPIGKTRVATIHYQTTETQPAQFDLKLQTAGDPQGNRISAQASFMERKTQ
jgi:hypothetical protein